MLHGYTEGDPVWVSLPDYEGTGIVLPPFPGAANDLLVQVRGYDPSRRQHRTLLVPEHLTEYAVRHYVRPVCHYCGSLRVHVDGMPAGCLRWDCDDCMGRQDVGPET